MSERHKFRELNADLALERRRRVEAKKAELMAGMPLRELRQAMSVPQLPDADYRNFPDTREIFTESHGGHDDR